MTYNSPYKLNEFGQGIPQSNQGQGYQQNQFGNSMSNYNQMGGYQQQPPPNNQSAFMSMNMYNVPPRSQLQSIDDVLGDYRQKTFNQIDTNLAAGATISELEQILEGERRKTKDVREKIESDLNNERKTRVDFENKLIRLKDEAMKREIYLKELEHMVTNSTQEKDSKIQEANALRDELGRMQELYNQKIREMDERVQLQQRSVLSQEDKYRYESERQKTENENNLDSLNRQWEFRFKSLEDKFKNLLGIKTDLENEIRQLHEQNMRIKLECEEEMRERAVRIQEEEYRKFLSNLRAMEQKLRACEEARENMVKTNQKLLKDIQEKDYAVNDNQLQYENELNRFKQEISDLHNQLSHSIIMRDKAIRDQEQRKTAIDQLQMECLRIKENENKTRENLKNQLETGEQKHLEEKRLLEDIRDQQARKIDERDQVIKQMEGEIDRLTKEYNALTENLQSNIAKTINQTYNDNMSYRTTEYHNKPQFGYKY